jgi:selenocysteine lyase/cysteine desulfurase
VSDIAPLLSPGRFVGLDGIAHLCAGSESPMLASHGEAVARFLANKSGGMAGRARLFEPVERARNAIGALLGLPAADVAFLLNASDGLAITADGLGLKAGDNVVMALGEYPSLPLAFLSAAERAGAELRYAGTGMVTETADYAASVDRSTRAIVVSHVSFLTGDRADLLALRALADSVGARLIVDASHSLGVAPVDGSLCDAVVSSCYKWLLAVQGCGIFAVNAARWPELMPAALGWHSVVPEDDWRAKARYRLQTSAQRFETGNPPFLALHVLDNALTTLAETSVEARIAHAVALSGRLRAGLVQLGLKVFTPEAPERRAGNVSFAADDAVAVAEALRAAGVLILAGGRGWNRISVHLYNGSDDVERCVAALKTHLASN